ncbi:hypothetical protein SKAU_G00124290 [Synaphobranchus kaupii]|uniref:Ig-like domain-containing protein n=1 Tax=Synaphobranchus kaupii TaxID=118154 RepID=A0A9Q1FPC2_SYNKA|nr:hypothetical protein SKAU_G00124290 [Synaphobranchus kaupii]
MWHSPPVRPPAVFLLPWLLAFPVTSVPRAMWANQLPPLRMGLQPLYPLLLALLATWQVAETLPVLIIESVKLTVLPGHHVESGTNVTLQCDPQITSSTGHPLTHQYTFYRDSTTVYTKNTTTGSPLAYLIPQARVANSGSYKCSVTVHGKHSESSSKLLNVTGLQTPVLFINKSFVTEGEEVTASCSAPKEFGSFYFYFYEGSKEVKKMATSSNVVKAELKFTSQGNKSLYCEYVIDLQPGVIRSSKSTTSQVYVQELSIRPSIEILPSTNIIEGDILQITCNVSGSRQKSITVYVSKDSDIKQNGEDSIVYVKKVLSDDSGVYECKSMMGNVLKSVNSSVVVSELFSKPILTMEPHEVFEKESFSLACSSANISTERIQQNDVKYSLYNNGRLLTAGDFRGKFSNKAHTSHNGNYTCEAVAKMIRKPSNVIVFKAKVLVSKPLINVFDKVIVGKPFRVHCHCENGSLPISYTLLNNKVTQQPIMRVREPNYKAFFTVTIRRKEDIRNFTCEAENNGYSSKKESEALNVTVIEPVSNPTLLIMPNYGKVTEGEELYLACSVREGSPPITFKWYRDGLDQPMYTTTTKERSESYTLGHAIGDHSGKYHCVAVNWANEAVPSKVAVISVSLARWKKVLIGAFCLLLLAALVGFGCYRYRAKRGKRETATELSVKPSSPKSEDSLTVSLAHDTEVYNAHKGAAPHFDGTEGRAANGTRDSVASLPVNGSNRSSYNSVDVGGRSVWSERESDSDTDNQSSEEAPKEPDVEYTEVVHLQPADGSRAPVRKGTDTVYSELQNSSQGVADQSGYGSVEYAQLNHGQPEPV